MSNKILLHALSVLILFGVTIACAGDQPDQMPPKEEGEGHPPLNSRASEARAISLNNIFVKLPEEAFPSEGWNNLSPKERRELLSKGSLDPFEAEVKDHYLVIKERFQNEDDENERTIVVEMAIFRHSEEDYNVVFVGQKYVYENGRKPDEPISNSFWRFDGRHWHKIDEIPSLSTADFFEEDFDLSKVKNDHILLSPNPKYDNTLTASLSYEQYLPYGLTPDELVTNESYIINLIWNGQMFELQRKPTLVE